ncbi:MAG: cbb3-type cytochrome c oxidase subunit I, partial [Gemmatimonadetes bacterium]|nr:cbb3-type cytochrome c oxidase subunit I [Gemmatimonadota bacterium]
MVTAFVFFLVGGTLAGMMRTQLAVPENQFLGPESYNRIFTMHGTTMIFYFATPMLTGIATYILPLMLGTRDLAFPRLNAFAYWVFLFSGLFIYTSFLVDEVPDGGWFAYVPLTGPNYSQGLGMDFWTLAILFLGISTTAAAINFVV